MIDTVFFDLGNVLVFFDHGKMQRQIATTYRLELALVENVFTRHYISYEKNDLTTEALHELLCHLAQRPIPLDEGLFALSNIFELNATMVPIVETLKAKGLRLYILSNTCAPHFEFLYARYPVLHLFDGYVLSYQTKSRKPEHQIFKEALSIASRQDSPSSCFYTDDISEYVNTARTLHFEAEIFTHAHSLKEQLITRGIL